jgi:AraC-like DNA-binding protein
MRREYVEYLKDLPINISLANIMEYPLHWQDSIELLFVLRGSIEIGIENEVYILKEREIDIINSNEVYRIKSDDPDNMVLIINIDPNFFEKYYDDAKEIFFYTKSPDVAEQEGERYDELRKFVSIIFYEAVSKLDDYEDEIEDHLLEMMYHLLNNFHYLFYEEESLRDDEVLLERYHRIVKYLSNNYMNKVSLQYIADKEFLSSQYLSFKIKDTFGHGFNEFLNQIRVEESVKLLLDTDKNISEIAEDVGFSHVRYYNKHFKLQYNTTPMQYRKSNKVSDETLEKMKKINYLDIKEAIPFLTNYLSEYERFEYENRIIKLDVDLDTETIMEFEKPDLIDLGDISLLLEEENRRILEEIGFKYCIINRLFSSDMDIFRGKNERFINWTRVENILDFIRKLKLKPIINSKGIEKHIIEDFVENFTAIYEEDAEQWLNVDVESLNPSYVKVDLNPVYDTIEMIPYIIHNYTHLGNRIVLNMIDEITKDIELSNDTFFGGSGLYTSNYLNKPSYYALMLLSQLGGEVIYRGEGYIVTKSEKGYQILLYNPIEVDPEWIYDNSPKDKIKERTISINIYNMKGDFQITRFDLNRDHGSVYDKWTYLGRPERIDNNHWDLLKEYVHPRISFYHGKKSIVFNVLTTVKPNGTVLFLLNSV